MNVGNILLRSLRSPATSLLLLPVIALMFFVVVGKPPFKTLFDMAIFAFGGGYAISETLVKATPIIFCALAVAIPARLGLISVGADGQLYLGAIVGTGVALQIAGLPAAAAIPICILAGALGGALWAGIPAVLKVKLGANETITTLLLNYVGVLCVDFLVYGPWKDPTNLGWPATASFAEETVPPHLFGTRAHIGLLIALGASIVLHFLMGRSRWGLTLRFLRDNQRLGEIVGIGYVRQVILVMCIGGALAGVAGWCEASAVQGRLQSGLSLGYGLTGFLVAWLARQNMLAIIPISILIGGLLSSADSLQMFAKLPAVSVVILQALLFIAALGMMGLAARFEEVGHNRGRS